MKFTFKRKYILGISIGVFIALIDFLLFFETAYFLPTIIFAISVAWGQMWLDFFIETKRQRDVEEKFVDFVRNLTGAIKSGMPVSRAIRHVSTIDYGALSPYVLKLGRQVEWAIPVHKALLFFSNATRSDIIKRAIATVIEAEQSGGNMEDVLSSITQSLIEIKKIKEERRAAIQSQVLQSYLIFFIFIAVMIVIQNLLVPTLLNQNSGGIGGLTTGSVSSNPSTTVMTVEIEYDSLARFVITLSRWFVSLRGVFLMLSLIQGLFAGLIIGKLSEGDITAGLKHSLILVTSAFFIMSLFKPPGV